MTTIEEIFQKYTPKPELRVCVLKSTITGKYSSTIWQKNSIIGTRKVLDALIASTSTEDFTEFFNFLKPYINERIPTNSQGDTVKV